jgi:hypothetical protein
MNSIQLTIVIVILLMIVVTIGYYWYQEAKFKKMVESNFNQQADDVIAKEKPLVLQGGNLNSNQGSPQNQKDIITKDIADLFDDATYDAKHDSHLNNDDVTDDHNSEMAEANDVPLDSMEAFFVKIAKIPFPYKDYVDNKLDYFATVAFEEPTKIKVLPDLSQFTSKPIRTYVLNSDNMWVLFERGQKYTAAALKVIIPLVDKDGVVSNAQIANVYNELYKFVLQHNAHVQQSNYEANLNEIQRQYRYLKDLVLDLELFLYCKDLLDLKTLDGCFTDFGLMNCDGVYTYIKDGVEIFKVSAEESQPFDSSKSYNLVSVVSSLHLTPDPKLAIEIIFDFAEKFMSNFESRLLTVNKDVFSQKDYSNLNSYIRGYIASARKNNIDLGGPLLFRVLNCA